MKQRNLRSLAVIALILLLMSAVLASCGGGKGTSGVYDNYYEGGYAYGYDYEDEEYYNEKPAMTADETYAAAKDNGVPAKGMAATPSPAQTASERKRIYTVNVEMQTKDFDTVVANIITVTESSGGYIESSSVSGSSYDRIVNRYASFSVRVPAKSLDATVDKLCEGTNVVSRSTSVSDVTAPYYDNEARLQSLLTQEERLLAMLETADELEYMLQLEDKLAQVRYQIESINSTLRLYDSQIAYSTVIISLEEVIEYTPVVEAPKSYGSRISTAFKSSWSEFAEGWRDFSVEFVYALPTLLVLAIITIIIVLIVRAIVRRAKKKTEAARRARMEEYAAMANAGMVNAGMANIQNNGVQPGADGNFQNPTNG